MRNDWARECLEAYHRIIPKSEPVEDWEKRIQLYALYVQLLYPFSIPPSPIPCNPYLETNYWG